MFGRNRKAAPAIYWTRKDWDGTIIDVEFVDGIRATRGTASGWWSNASWETTVLPDAHYAVVVAL